MNKFSRLLERRLSAIVSTPILESGQFNAGYVSFGFDDFPKSAACIGAQILEKYGARGTYYVSMGLAGQVSSEVQMFEKADLERLVMAGHEIGCHTFSHYDFYQGGHMALNVAEEISKNALEIQSNFAGVELHSFAYPKGRVTSLGKRFVRKSFLSGRGVSNGVNNARADLYELKSNPIYSETFNYGEAHTLIKNAIDGPGWTIFYTHDVDEDRPSRFGCKASELEEVVELARLSGARILPVGEVLKEVWSSE